MLCCLYYCVCTHACRYALLEKEVHTVYDQLRAGDTRTLLLKLKQFILVENDAIPQVLEKLCLLVMSLPANYLSLGPVVTSIQVNKPSIHIHVS